MSLVLDEVIKDLYKQEIKGLSKYGTTLDSEFTELEMEQHLYEELLDAAMYIKKLMLIKKSNKNATNY